MSNKEFSELLKHGLELSEKRMRQEKALRGEDVITCDANNNIVRIPAQQVIDSHPAFRNQ